MLVANIKIWKSHLNLREGSDYIMAQGFKGQHRKSHRKFANDF